MYSTIFLNHSQATHIYTNDINSSLVMLISFRISPLLLIPRPLRLQFQLVWDLVRVIVKVPSLVVCMYSDASDVWFKGGLSAS